MNELEQILSGLQEPKKYNINEIKPNDEIGCLLPGVEEASEEWNYYEYDYGPDSITIGVPRVSHIISQCSDQRYLIDWAAKIGYNKYTFYRDKALEVGTLVHETIDRYLTYKYINKDVKNFRFDPESIDYVYRDQVCKAFNNFLNWEKALNSNGYFIEEVIGLEIPVITPWYGGTVDAILRINGCYYIIDFKTSKRISTDYFIQTIAYMWAINNIMIRDGHYLPFIDGIGIIRVDKTKSEFEDVFLNKHIPQQAEYLVGYCKAFMSYLESYYRNININYISNIYKANYSHNIVFDNKNKIEEVE